jgi:drug/metabolite transporter (DMT)-like permease
MEPVFAALFAWLWLAELLTWTAAIGGAMVILAVLLSEWRSSAESVTRVSA